MGGTDKKNFLLAPLAACLYPYSQSGGAAPVRGRVDTWCVQRVYACTVRVSQRSLFKVATELEAALSVVISNGAIDRPLP